MRQFLLLTVAFAVCLSGCSKSDDRFLGKWTFDRDYTQAHLPRETPQPSVRASPSEAADIANGVNGMMNGLKPMLTGQLIAQMEGQTFSITPKLVTDSGGETRTYQVIEHATPDDLSLKLSNGDIWTLSMEDGRIYMPTTGSVHFKLFFKRVNS